MIKLLSGFTYFRFSNQLSKAPVPVFRQETASGKDKYRNYHKGGPELFVTHILMVNGPLTNKEIWRIYERKLHESKKKGI